MRYEYQCERCGCFEVTQKMSDPPLSKHECGAPAQRLISNNTMFQLKGNGWYRDGYGSRRTSESGKTERAA